MTVVTCYTAMGTFSQQAKYLALIRLWKRAWSQAGFNAVAIDALHRPHRHPLRHALKDSFDRSPTVNDREYEWHCYCRWLILSEFAAGFEGPVLMVDGDVFPNPKSKNHDFWQTPAAFRLFPFQVLDSEGNPCAVLANSEGVEGWIRTMIDTAPEVRITYNGRPHTSDMILAQSAFPRHPSPVCENWKPDSTMPLVHVGTDTALKHGFDAWSKHAFFDKFIGTFRKPART